MSKEKEKIIAVVGTTASGKTTLAVELCLQLGGEIVSADSRQVFKYMDIGSGKDLAEYTVDRNNKKINIPYHMIDVVEPNDEFDLYKWLTGAKKSIDTIIGENKVPVVAGGTGLYAQALIDGYGIIKEPINKMMRLELEKFDAKELFLKLEQIDNDYANLLNNSEKNNKRRLIREVELRSTGKAKEVKKEKPYHSLILGVTRKREILKKRIADRLKNRFEQENMLEEVKMLHSRHNVSYDRLESFGLEYKLIAQHLQGKISMEDMKEKLYIAICQFSKRQMTWLRRWEKQGTVIHWIDNQEEAIQKAKQFILEKNV